MNKKGSDSNYYSDVRRKRDRSDLILMMKRSMHRIVLLWLSLVSFHLLFLALATFTTVFQNTLFEAFGFTALVIPYALHYIGLPVLENDGFSGGGWASPNILGWFFSAIAWFAFYWLVAIGIVRLTMRSRPMR